MGNNKWPRLHIWFCSDLPSQAPASRLDNSPSLTLTKSTPTAAGLRPWNSLKANPPRKSPPSPAPTSLLTHSQNALMVLYTNTSKSHQDSTPASNGQDVFTQSSTSN